MMEYNREREAEIERRVKRRIQRRMLLVLNFVVFFFYAMLVSGRNVGDALPVIAALWLLVVAAHAVLVTYWEWTERAVRNALAQERNAYYRAIAETVLADLHADKPKRDQRLALDDDGEFVEPEAFDERAYRKRR